MTNIYFLDIDDCLIHTSQLTDNHLSAIKNQLKISGVAKAKEITNEFALSFRRMYDNHQGKPLTSHEEKLNKLYMQRLIELEKPVLEKFGEVKRWSREVCLYIAAQKIGITLTNDEIISVTNILWAKITQYAVFYPDAKPFLQNLINKTIPFYLITSSDSRLTMDDDTQLFHYDPEYSRNLKLQRLKIFTDMGIPQENIFIGDPYDKPKIWVFEEALKKARKDYLTFSIKTGDASDGFTLNKFTMKGIPISAQTDNRRSSTNLGYASGRTRKLKYEKYISVMIGDSVANDLIPAKKAGMEKLIWINRNAKLEKQEKDGILILNSLNSLDSIITTA